MAAGTAVLAIALAATLLACETAAPTSTPAGPSSPGRVATVTARPAPPRAATPTADASVALPRAQAPRPAAPAPPPVQSPASRPTGTLPGPAATPRPLIAPSVPPLPAGSYEVLPPEPSPTGTPDVPPLRGPGSVPVPKRLQPLPLQPDPELATAVARALGPAAADYAVVVKRLTDGRGATLHAEQVFYAASLFKLAVLYELYHQRELGFVRLDEPLLFTPHYAEFALGELSWPEWSRVPVYRLAEAMITYSDNSAAMMLHDKLGGWNINAHLAALGLTVTKMVPELPTNAADLALLLEGIASGQTVSGTASAEMLGLLSRQRVNDRIPAGLPPGTTVAHKTGNWENACHDAGIVVAPSGPYVLVVLSSEAVCAPTVAALSAEIYAVLEGGAGHTAASTGPRKTAAPR